MGDFEGTLENFLVGKEDSHIWMKRLCFTEVLVCSNLLQTMFTKTQEDMTSKQWLLLTIASSVDEPPTLSELGAVMGCSRQNIKQIADVLCRKGYLAFTKIQGDKNTVRIVPTHKWAVYAAENEKVTGRILEEIFEGFSHEEIKLYFKSFMKIIKNIEKINKGL